MPAPAPTPAPSSTPAPAPAPAPRPVLALVSTPAAETAPCFQKDVAYYKNEAGISSMQFTHQTSEDSAGKCQERCAAVVPTSAFGLTVYAAFETMQQLLKRKVASLR